MPLEPTTLIAVSETIKDGANRLRTRSRTWWRTGSLGLAALLGSAFLGCSGGGLGAPCTSNADCDDDYQCLGQICAPLCTRNSDCGDGYQCDDKQHCQLVISAIGDLCTTEWDCGFGQSCILDTDDTNGDGRFSSTCQAQGEGGNVGSICASDSDCRNTLCVLGHCSQVCTLQEDCPTASYCDSIPRLIGDPNEGRVASFSGCLPAGVLSTPVPVSSSSETIYLPVPKGAESFSIVTRSGDPAHLVGVTKLTSPSGQTLFHEPTSKEEFLANPVRYARSRDVSTLQFPSDAFRETEEGIYEVEIEASLPPFGPGTEVPEVTAHYKLTQSRILDLTFYFTNLEEHACGESLDGDTLNAGNALASTQFVEDYVGEIRNIFDGANIRVATPLAFEDIDRPDLDDITSEEELRKLFSLATNESGVAVFFVRSLPSSGIQTLGTTIPGPPRTPGTPSSGIAVSLDSLCYRPWETLARITAHSIAGQMGLWNNRDPEGTFDPIEDSDRSTENLMYFGEFGGTELSTGQSRVLGLYPGLR